MAAEDGSDLEQIVDRWTTDTSSVDRYKLVLPEQVGMGALGVAMVLGGWRQRYVNGVEKPWNQIKPIRFNVAGLAIPPHAVAYKPGMWTGVAEPNSDWDASVLLSEQAAPVLLEGQDNLAPLLEQPDQAHLPGYRESRRIITRLLLGWLATEPKARHSGPIATNVQLMIASSLPPGGDNASLVKFVRQLAEARPETDRPDYLICFKSEDENQPIANLVLSNVQGSASRARGRVPVGIFTAKVVVPLSEVAIPDDHVLKVFKQTFATTTCTVDQLAKFLNHAIHPVTILGGNFLPNVSAIIASGSSVGPKEAAIAGVVKQYIGMLPGERRVHVGSYSHFAAGGIHMQVAYEPTGDQEAFYRMMAAKLGVKLKMS